MCFNVSITLYISISSAVLGDADRYSFDSDGFDEESICSWISEPESLCNVWRGWTLKNSSKQLISSGSATGELLSAAKRKLLCKFG